MADKRPLLLQLSDNENDADDKESEAAMATNFKLKPHVTPTLISCYFRQLLLRRKLWLCLLMMSICFYFLLGPADILELQYDNAIVAVHHQSNALDMEAEGSAPPRPMASIEPPTSPPPQPPPLPTTAQLFKPNITLPSQGYLVYSNHCKIVDLDPYKRDVMSHFKRESYKPCKKYPPLTKLRYDEKSQRYVLAMDPKALPSYKSSVQLSNSTDNIIVKCLNEEEQIYVNGYATIPERWQLRERLSQWSKKDAPQQRVPSVLLIGIESISRVNLIRAMPKTAQYLYDNDWFELAGYNKIDDNTFPNIMALMTGYNLSSAMQHCSPYRVDGLDNCSFLWKQYQQHGYATAYGEDAVKIKTFKYLKKGFKQPPVDYYLRPYLTAAEKLLGGNVLLGLPHCVGFETEAEHVYNYALEFARRYRNDSYFGFFWTNTHSHSDISQSSSMEDYLKEYLGKLVAQGTMEHSIVVFFSDHGLRFGPTRNTWSGHYEERLPLLFIWLPKYLRQRHPEFVDALQLNRNRLTTPYDLHLTLKHFLALSGRAGSLADMGPAQDCPQCQSLLLPVPLSRSCRDVAISDHWCTCWSYDHVYKNSKTVRQLAKYVVHYLNDYVTSFRNGSFAHFCMPLSLQSMSSAYKAHANPMDPAHIKVYRLIFYTSPNKALYEATVRHNEKLPGEQGMQVTGSVSRLNMYNGEANCLGDFSIRKYCFCRQQK
ncbi:CG7120 [Drosophila busckii]|uniref:CG7120 n=1 Tax=Drosophila busckii TaxID=30019 RepID=A0A0M4EB32_DROBS|nr:CG7120 [Drosophila busckii]